MIKKYSGYLLLALLMLTIISCGSSNQAQEKDNVSQTNQEPTTAATAEINEINNQFIFNAYDTKGTLHSSSEWIGKQPVVINFWGTWCPPCRREIPELKKLYAEYNSRGVEILGIAVPRREQAKDIENFASQQEMYWQLLIATQEMGVKYSIQSVPTTIFLDKNGNEVDRLIGLHDYENLKKSFEKIL